ncbi:MAG TPA: TIGR02266 family protein [Kofleriaceae bacterium]|nr:TIGR02266 family protein [Kofleriaceae bacterium]
MADSGGADRRVYRREKIELKVEYKRLNAFFSDYTKNISQGGTFIKTKKPLEVGTEFVFKLFVPKLDFPIELRGKVKWVITEEDVRSAASRGAGGAESGMGIRFLYEDAKERAEIERVVEKLMIDSLGPRVTSRLKP